MKTLVHSEAGIILQYGAQFIQEVWLRGCMDRDHKIIHLVDKMTDASIFKEVPSDFGIYRNIDAAHFINNAIRKSVTKNTYREVVLKTELEIH